MGSSKELEPAKSRRLTGAVLSSASENSQRAEIQMSEQKFTMRVERPRFARKGRSKPRDKRVIH